MGIVNFHIVSNFTEIKTLYRTKGGDSYKSANPRQDGAEDVNRNISSNGVYIITLSEKGPSFHHNIAASRTNAHIQKRQPN